MDPKPAKSVQAIARNVYLARKYRKRTRRPASVAKIIGYQLDAALYYALLQQFGNDLQELYGAIEWIHEGIGDISGNLTGTLEFVATLADQTTFYYYKHFVYGTLERFILHLASYVPRMNRRELWLFANILCDEYIDNAVKIHAHRYPVPWDGNHRAFLDCKVHIVDGNVYFHI